MAKYQEASGYIIHMRPFKDSSLIIEFFSQEFGLLHIIAKGIKKNKQLKSQLQYFNFLSIQFYGKSSLKNLTSINVVENYQLTKLVDRMSALYLNELLHFSLQQGEVAELLFKSYKTALHSLPNMKLSLVLRTFEFQLLKYVGFELSVNQFKNPNDWLTMDQNHGLVKTTQEKLKLCSASDLARFINGEKLARDELKNINKIMYAAINMSLSHKKLYSRDLLQSLLSK